MGTGIGPRSANEGPTATNNTQNMKTWSEARQYAEQRMEIKVKVADLRREQYDPRWIYVNRIGKKVRILSQKDAIHNGGTIRSTIKITWNEDTYTREQMRRHVQRMIPALAHFATMGSVHPFRRCSDVSVILCGGLDQSTPGRWYMIQPTEPNIKATRMRILGIR